MQGGSSVKNKRAAPHDNGDQSARDDVQKNRVRFHFIQPEAGKKYGNKQPCKRIKMGFPRCQIQSAGGGKCRKKSIFPAESGCRIEDEECCKGETQGETLQKKFTGNGKDQKKTDIKECY